jgi:hypothetical protein
MVKYEFTTQIVWGEEQECIVCDMLLSKFRRRVVSVEYRKDKFMTSCSSSQMVLRQCLRSRLILLVVIR